MENVSETLKVLLYSAAADQLRGFCCF